MPSIPDILRNPGYALWYLSVATPEERKQIQPFVDSFRLRGPVTHNMNVLLERYDFDAVLKYVGLASPVWESVSTHVFEPFVFSDLEEGKQIQNLAVPWIVNRLLLSLFPKTNQQAWEQTKAAAYCEFLMQPFVKADPIGSLYQVSFFDLLRQFETLDTPLEQSISACVAVALCHPFAANQPLHQWKPDASFRDQCLRWQHEFHRLIDLEQTRSGFSALWCWSQGYDARRNPVDLVLGNRWVVIHAKSVDIQNYQLLRHLIGIASFNLSPHTVDESVVSIEYIEIWDLTCGCIERWHLTWTLEDQRRFMLLAQQGLIPTDHIEEMVPYLAAPDQTHVLQLFLPSSVVI